MIGIDCTGSCKYNHHTTKTRTAPYLKKQIFFLLLATYYHWWCNLVFIFVNKYYPPLTNNTSHLLHIHEKRHTQVLNFFNRRKCLAYLWILNVRNIKVNLYWTYWQHILHRFISILLNINYLHISDLDSKIIRFTGFTFL